MNYIAHSNFESCQSQSVLEHLTNTAKLASEFAKAFGAQDIGYLCGMLHDIGKYSDKFQRRIRGSGERVDHSTAGALEAIKLRNVPAAFCVAGHHGGLPDGGNRKIDTPDEATLSGKINRKVGTDIEDYSAFKSEVVLNDADIPAELTNNIESAFFFTHMLYSCLVDADFLDTEAFLSGNTVDRHLGESMEALASKLTDYMAPWMKPETEINKKRCEILTTATSKSNCESGLFSLTVPTGGGKTIASMSFAINHAMKNGQRRIIYVIPYTSIIEQTQSIFESVFGSENVLAHYANVEYKTDENSVGWDKHYLAAENWDAPIILTTTVQFFESLYANRSSKCRKLHNIANSVIVFDEAQMLPVPYLKPCIAAISQLVEHYGCSAVLCTATQPSLNRLFDEICPQYRTQEICPNVTEMYEFFRRATYRNVGLLSDEQLAACLSNKKQVLCIVNNRKQAQDIYSMLDKDGSYHLSTTMYPSHRRRILAEIRGRLLSGKDCRVVSTSLVEAGVDVDFPTVYRALSGLDSIIQAGGRCNREGKCSTEESIVYIFESSRKTPKIIQQNIAASEHVMRKFKDISSPEAARAYFDFLYYTLKDETSLDMKNILGEINAGTMPFASIAEQFKIIENANYTIYIPCEDGDGLVKILKKYGVTRNLMRKLGQYAVGVYPEHFSKLIELGAADKLTENTAVLRDLSLYDQNTGLAFDIAEGKEIIV